MSLDLHDDKALKIVRRHRWGGTGCMPDDVSSMFSEGERAALAVVAYECAQHVRCFMSIGEIEQEAGVSATTVHRALRLARPGHLGLFDIVDRTEWGMTNIVRIRDRAWLDWMAGGKWVGPADFRRADR